MRTNTNKIIYIVDAVILNASKLVFKSCVSTDNTTTLSYYVAVLLSFVI